MIVGSAPARVGLLGNPSDGYGGRTLGLAVNRFQATVEVEAANGLEIIGNDDDRPRWTSLAELVDRVDRHGYGTGPQLLVATIRTLADVADSIGHPGFDRLGCTVRYHTTIPRSVGLGGSSALIIAAIRAVGGLTGLELPDPVLASGIAAFANSYCLPAPPPGWAVASSLHGRRFVAALRRGDVLLCQFHPELSGAYGLELMRRWLTRARRPLPRRESQTRAGLTLRIVPCLDVRHGEVVKGIRFQGLRRAGVPAERAALYERQGADEWGEPRPLPEPVNVDSLGEYHAALARGGTVYLVSYDRPGGYGRSDLGQGRRVQVEFVSANPTGPLHVGHGRGAAYGATVADLLQAVGFGVHREDYVNDAGRQMDILDASVWLR